MEVTTLYDQPMIAPAMDKQLRHRRASFNQCHLGPAFDRDGAMCARPSEPSACRNMFGVRGTHTSSKTSTEFKLPLFSPDHLEQFNIIRQLGAGRSGALVFMVSGQEKGSEFLLKVYLNAVIPPYGDRMDSDRVYRELYALCRLTGRPGFPCVSCFGLAPLPPKWIRMPQFIGDKPPLDVRLLPDDPALHPPLVAFVITTMARGVPLADLPLQHMPAGELAGTALEIAAVWQTLQNQLGDSVALKSGQHNDMHTSNIFVSQDVWRRPPIELNAPRKANEAITFPYVTLIDFDLSTSDAFPEPNSTVAFSPWGIREATLAWCMKHLGTVDTLAWVTNLAALRKMGALPDNQSDIYHILTYFLVFATYYQHVKAGSPAGLKKGAMVLIRRLSTYLLQQAEGQQQPLDRIWNILTAARSQEEPGGPEEEEREGEDELGRKITILKTAARRITQQIWTSINELINKRQAADAEASSANPLDAVNRLVSLFQPDQQLAYWGSLVADSLRDWRNEQYLRQQGLCPSLAAITGEEEVQQWGSTLRQYYAENDSLWPDIDHLALQFASPRAGGVLHLSLQVVHDAQLHIFPLFFRHLVSAADLAWSLRITTEGFTSWNIEWQPNLAIFAPSNAWARLLLHQKEVKQLLTQPLLFEGEEEAQQEANKPKTKAGAEVEANPTTRLVLHTPLAEVPANVVENTGTIVFLDRVSISVAKDIHMVVRFRLRHLETASFSSGDERLLSLRTSLLPVITFLVLRLAVAFVGKRMKKEQSLTLVELHEVQTPGDVGAQDEDVLTFDVLMPQSEPLACISAVTKSLSQKAVFLPDTLDCIANLQALGRQHFRTPEANQRFQQVLLQNVAAIAPSLDVSLLLLPYKSSTAATARPPLELPVITLTPPSSQTTMTSYNYDLPLPPRRVSALSNSSALASGPAAGLLARRRTSAHSITT